MVVIDSSALLDSLLDDASYQNLMSIAALHELVAPDHIDIECLSAMRKMERLGYISEKQASQIIGELANIRCHRLSIHSLLSEIWTFRNNFTAYDAAYVAIAVDTGSALITHDQRLARAASPLIKTLQLYPAP